MERTLNLFHCLHNCLFSLSFWQYLAYINMYLPKSCWYFTFPSVKLRYVMYTGISLRLYVVTKKKPLH
ncbi:hypothetical protein F4809DRAFT_600197 [Biscogniauxia mediterranea]|nr:hypothetical protein F4809DRAFT_600197 [Biscogniauxia mediterranea]